MSAWPLAPLVEQRYRAIVIDPPWKFSAGTKGRPQHYQRMTDAEFAALPLARLAQPEGAFFFLWITSPIDGPRFWQNIYPGWKRQGLRYSARAFVWAKTHRVGANGGDALFVHRDSFFIGQGFTTRKNVEDCLLFRIGAPKRQRRDVRELILSPLREHSRKPDEAFDRVISFCAGPYAEGFARESREGWETFGDESTKFDGESA